MVDMVPPATVRDRWMYKQGRLAERDPRTKAAEQAVQHGFDAASLLFEVERPKGELNQETIHERKLMERVCKCSLRTRLVGDGCEVCNPELAKELAEQGAELSDEQIENLHYGEMSNRDLSFARAVIAADRAARGGEA